MIIIKLKKAFLIIILEVKNFKNLFVITLKLILHKENYYSQLHMNLNFYEFY